MSITINTGGAALTAVQPVSMATVLAHVYYSGYTKLGVTLDTSKISSTTALDHWNVTYRGSKSANIPALTTLWNYSKTVVKEQVEIVVDVYNTGGEKASVTLQRNLVPETYVVPYVSGSVTACRSNSSGTPASDGTYLKLQFKAKCSDCYGRNSMTAAFTSMDGSGAAGPSGSLTIDSETEDATNDILTTQFSALTGGFNVSKSYTITVTITDGCSKTGTMTRSIPSEVYAFHIRNKGAGVAFGKAAEADNQCQIPDGWKYYRGTHKVFDDGDTIGIANGGTGNTTGAAKKLDHTVSPKVTLGSTTAVTNDLSGNTMNVPVSGTLKVANGGTGGTDAAGARSNLGFDANVIEPYQDSTIPDPGNYGVVSYDVRTAWKLCTMYLSITVTGTVQSSWENLRVGMPEPYCHQIFNIPHNSDTPGRPLRLRVKTDGTLQVARGVAGETYNGTFSYMCKEGTGSPA